MAKSTNLPLSEPATREEVDSLCAAIDPNGDAPMVTPSDHGLVPVTWLTYLQADACRFERFHELLEPAYPYFDAELVAVPRSASTHSYLSQIRQVAAPVDNPNLMWLAPALYDYSETCRRVKEYYERQVRTILNG